ncbi:MAG: hypothetical protein GY811_26480 [Myxococcales bacterium]|nr:hypothetical protein [Myxococcales bacterium]
MGSIASTGWLYVAACLAAPAISGVLSAWIFGRIDARRRKATGDPQDTILRPPVDYSI